jgi:Putative DNA-binding domain
MRINLAVQQTALLDFLHSNAVNSIALCADSMPGSGVFSLENPDATLRGLRAYRANAQALAESALLAAYPVLQQLIGEENFRHIAQDFWQAMPPERGDLAQWGRELPEYLPQVPQLQALLQAHPYVSDVARAEWALHVAGTATDAGLDAASFQLLAAHDPAQLRLLLSPGCALIRSTHPIVALIQLHDPRASEAHEAARVAIASGEPQTALVWRQGLRPVIGAVDSATAAFIETTLQGQPLSAALDAAFAQTPDFDFSTWLAEQVQSGVLLGAALQTQSPEAGSSE